MTLDTVSKSRLFDHLKSETADIHKDVEAVNPVLQAWFDVDAYQIYLSRIAELYASFEEKWDTLPTKLFNSMNLAERRKSTWLAQDLSAVGQAKNLSKLKITTHCQTADDLVGGLYVLEGSSLGGQIIYRHLKAKLGLEDSVLRFFKGAGSETRLRWQGFKDASLSLDGLNAHAVTSSALSMFAAYKSVLVQIQQDLSDLGIAPIV